MRAYLSFIIAIFILCTSCNKDKNNDNTSNNNNSGNKLLRSFKQVSGADSIRFNYTYDGQNRISTTHVYEYENSSLTDEVVYTYSYNGNDTVLSNVRSVYTDYTGGSSGTDKEYFTVDNSGKLQKDSIVSDQDFMTYQFNYFSDHFQVVTNFLDTVVARQSFSNGNLVAEHDTISGFYILGLRVDISLAFDNHPNPFYYTGIKRVLLHMPENYLQDIEEVTPVFKNNPTDINSVSTGAAPGNWHYQYSYSYDTDGYPITSTINDITNAQVYTGFYFY